MHQVPAVAAPHWAAGDYPVIPGGRYVRGCSAANYKSCAAAEGPPTLTWLSQFGLSYSEITVSKYKDCVTAKSCTTPADISGGTYKAGGPTMPVNAVTWQQCRDYCRWAGGDLPTEAQWARAGSVPCAPNATDVACLKIAPQLYPWGNDAPTCTKANATLAGKVCTNGPRDTQLLPATSSVTGHEGLAGNLSEWVLDAYSTTALKDLSPYDPYLADPANSNRGVRGGSWLSAPKDLRTHQRLYFGTPTLFRQQYGCRCAIR
ncbi:MAG: formylglycine-generating enzyme family protein, partial [Myxococcales bacterium]|nr:formylglycine-generating enzyme family protein [Myxococcales bacterium]